LGEQGGFIFVKVENEEGKIVKNGLVKAKQKAKPDHEVYRTIKADPRPSAKPRKAPSAVASNMLNLVGSIVWL
jgi:hypothetical protein